MDKTDKNLEEIPDVAPENHHAGLVKSCEALGLANM